MNDQMYTTRQVMELLGVKSRATLYNRGWTDRAVRAFPESDASPLMWPAELVAELAAEQGVEL